MTDTTKTALVLSPLESSAGGAESCETFQVKYRQEGRGGSQGGALAGRAREGSLLNCQGPGRGHFCVPTSLASVSREHPQSSSGGVPAISYQVSLSHALTGSACTADTASTPDSQLSGVREGGGGTVSSERPHSDEDQCSSSPTHSTNHTGHLRTAGCCSSAKLLPTTSGGLTDCRRVSAAAQELSWA